MMYYVYVLTNEEGKMYVGYTSELRQRLNNHNAGKNKSTKGQQWNVVYYEAYKSEQDARIREKKLKRSGQARRWLKERIKGSINS